jgi:tetrahydromethanopterin S-methyltransferase subunit G
MHVHPLEARIAHVEGGFEQVNERLGSVDRRLDTMDGRFNHLESRCAQVDARFNRVDSRFNWLTGIVVGTWITTMLTILFHR